jgi:hypothetical protein
MPTRCSKCGAVVEDDWPVCRKCFEPVKRPGLLSRLLRALGINIVVTKASQADVSSSVTGIVTRRTEAIKIRDSRTGEMREYHSMDEVPEEYREKIREAQEAALSGQRVRITWTDTSGQVHHYNSVEEMPPEIRAQYEKIRGK